MGLIDSLTGWVTIGYKARTEEAKAKIKELSGEQKKAAKEAADALDAQGKAADSLATQWAKGSAVIGATFLVARDGLRTYRDDVRLHLGSAGVDIDQLSEAYDGLRTQQDLMTLAQAGHQGAWKLTTGQIERVIGGMRALEKKGYEVDKVFERFTENLKKGSLEGLDDFGISLQSTGDKSKDLQLLMNALGREVLDVGGNFEKAGDAATRATVRMEDGLTRVRSVVGKVTAGLLDMAAAYGEGIGQAIFGNLPEDNGPGAKASVYAEQFARVGGVSVNDPNGIRIGNRKSADFLFAQPSDANAAAGRALAAFSSAVRQGMIGRGPLATATPQEFADMMAGLPKDWQLVDGFLADRAKLLEGKLQERFVANGRSAATGLVTGFKNAWAAQAEKNKRGGRGRGGRGQAAGPEGDTFFDVLVGTAGGFYDFALDFGQAKAAGAAAAQGRLDALGNASMLSDIEAAKASVLELKTVLEEAAQEKETWLESVFGPLEDFDAYTSALTTMTDVAQAAWGTVITAIANGEELSAGKIRKAIGNVLAAKAVDLGSDGLAAILRGAYHIATGDPRGPGEIAAGAAMSAGALAIAGAARAIGGSSASMPSGRGGGGGATRDGGVGRRTNDEGRPNYVVLGSSFDDWSPRQRARQVYRAVNNTTTVYRPPEGS